MNPFNCWCFVLFFCSTSFEYSSQLSLLKSASLDQYYSSQNNQTANSSYQQSSFFNLTYGSRLLYQLRDQVKSLQPDQKSIVSHTCAQALRSLLNAPTLDRWSLSMLDANAPMSASLLSDGITSLGGYDQCLAIDDQQFQDFYSSKNKKDELVTTSIRGQYCLLSLKIKSEENTTKTTHQDEFQRTMKHLSNVNRRFPLVLGLCIPSLCGPEEVNYLIKKYFFETKMRRIETKLEHCQTAQDFLGPKSEKPVLELLQEHNLLIVSSIFATVAIFVLAGTLVDLAAAKNSDNRSEHSLQKPSQFTTVLKVLRCFSLIQNTAILFGQSANSSSISKPENTKIEHRLGFLHGIRVTLVFWVVAAHSVALLPASIAMPVAMIARHPHDMLELAAKNGLSSTFFNSGTLAVEAFFLISGFLLVALSLDKHSLLQRITFPLFVALRWARFAPPLLGTIVFWKLVSLVGSGPFFARSLLQGSVQRPCQDSHWWRSFLFTNNWGNLSDTCIPPSWFLSADMQIHLIAYVLIILLRRRLKTFFHIFCVSMIAFSLAFPVCLLAFTPLKTFSNVDLFANTNEEIGENHITSYILFYTGAHVHMGAYFYGALLGYLLVVVVKSEKEKMIEKPRLIFNDQLTGGLVWWSSLAAILVGPFVNTQTSSDDHLKKGLLVGGLHLIWTLAFGLVLLILASTSSSIFPKSVTTVKHLLSWSHFRPLSRLSFTMYLSHMLLVWFNVYSLRVPFEVNTSSITLFTLGILTETILLSYLLFIFFEAPSVNLIKLVCGSCLHHREQQTLEALVKNKSESKGSATSKESEAKSEETLLQKNKLLLTTQSIVCKPLVTMV